MSSPKPFNRKFNSEIAGIVIFSLALLGVVCLFNPKVGLVTYYVEKVLRISTGEGRYLFPVLLAYLGIRLIQKSPREGGPQRLYGGIVLFMVSLTVIHLFVPEGKIWGSGLRGEGGGLLGALISLVLWRSFGLMGTFIILTAFALIGIMLVFNWRLNDFYFKAKNKLQTVVHGLKTFLINFLFVEETEEEKETHPIIIDFCGDEQTEQRGSPPEASREEESAGLTGSGAVKPVNGGPVLRLVKTPDNRWNQQSPGYSHEPEERNPAQGAEYHLPPTSLLSRPSTVKNVKASKDITENIRILEETLESFGVKAKVTQVSRGPAITRYEIQPPPGIKVSRIVSLADDVALSMAAPGVRIEAPIPGKAAVGIEVPNRETSTVHLRELLETDEFQKAPSRLTVSLGKDIAGTPVVADLALMPHLLIAGATGSGKSVCLNTLIASMLFKATPDQLKFLIIDPKMVELATYNGIPHLISPVVTDPKKAATSLRWAVKEMEYRYELFASAGVRDITRYNNSSSGRDSSSRSPLPYIVVIIDELADLMMVAPADVEDSVCRLAQMARAAGIHLMIATQRPSVDVITGLIKANIPSRISFAVSSQIDSRTILDMGGAEKLLGKGDMLFFPVGAAKPVRIQGAYLSDREVEQLVSFWKKQAVPVYHESLTGGEAESPAAYEPEDELLPRAVEIFIETGHASISMLQRRLHIGYARAARLIDIMEKKGIVGSFEGSKPRAVLMTMEQYEQTFNKVGNKNISGN